MGFSFDQVRDSLPNIGDRRNGGTVDYVNTAHLWYRVRYSWGTNSYKMPKAVRQTLNTKDSVAEPMLKKHTVPVKRYLIVETGEYYSSFEKIGEALGYGKTAVQNAYNKKRKLADKYTIVKNKEFKK